MSAVPSSRLLLKFVLPAAVKRTVRDHDDLLEGIAVDAHDAIDDTDVAKRPSHELQPLSEDIVVPPAMSSFRADKRSAEPCFECCVLTVNDARCASGIQPVCERCVLLPGSAVVPWNSFDFRKLQNIQTVGLPRTKAHEHPLGLTQVIFENCVVMVRKGCDLERIQALGRVGQVKLSNVSSCGWATTDKTLLPCCIFNRWMSSMSAAR